MFFFSLLLLLWHHNFSVKYIQIQSESSETKSQGKMYLSYEYEYEYPMEYENHFKYFHVVGTKRRSHKILLNSYVQMCRADTGSMWIQVKSVFIHSTVVFPTNRIFRSELTTFCVIYPQNPFLMCVFWVVPFSCFEYYMRASLN